MNKTIDTFHFWSHEVHSTTINTLGSRVAVANIEPISGERLRELLEIQKTVGGAEEAVQGLNVCMAEEGFRMVSTIRDSPTIYEGRDDDMRGGNSLGSGRRSHRSLDGVCALLLWHPLRLRGER